MKNGSKSFFALALLFLMILGTLPAVLPQARAATGTPTAATSLTISVIPLRLPADGSSYAALVVGFEDAASNPSLPFNSTTVYLATSDDSIGTVPASVVIPAGQDYVVVDFQTTREAGTAVVTASAAGYTSAQVVVNTRVPSGYASQLKVVGIPSDIQAGGSGTFAIQLEDSTGAPALAPAAVNVSLVSSAQQTVQPSTKYLLIPAGSDVAYANFTAGYLIGDAYVTASSTSFVAGTVSLSVIGASPYVLHVSAQPAQVVEKGSGRVVVWLTDQVGHPAAAASAVTVAIASSNLSIAQFSRTTIVISAGHISATANFTAGSILGSATVTASAQNLQTGFDTISTYKSLYKPVGIRLYVGPNPLPANSASYPAIVVSIVNSTGFPALATSSIVVNLTSASTGLGTITSSVTIPAGSESATAAFTTSYLVGTSIITASAQNLRSTQGIVTTYGPIPASLVVNVLYSTVLANGATDAVVAVALVDSSGASAIAPAPITVHLTSSKPSIATTAPYLTLKTGESYVLTAVQTGVSSGTTNITASAPNYGASSGLLSTTIPAPTGIKMYIAPSTAINQTAGGETVLSVQLQDFNGLPAKASVPTTITITSSNTAVVSKPIVLLVKPGQDYATTTISTLGAGKTNLTATAPGLGATSKVLTVLSSPTSVTLAPTPQVPYANQSSTITLSVNALGQGVPGASVLWFTTFGTLSTNNGTTNSAGQAVVSLFSNATGVATVTATVSNPLTGTVNATTTVVFQSVPVTPKQSVGQKIGSFIYIIIAVIIVILALVAFFVMRRTRRGRPEEEGEEAPPLDELEEQPGPDETGEEALAWRGGVPHFSGEGP